MNKRIFYLEERPKGVCVSGCLFGFVQRVFERVFVGKSVCVLVSTNRNQVVN